jgi:hypothetical protein
MKGFVLTNDELAELKEVHRKAKRSNAHAAYKVTNHLHSRWLEESP